MDNIIFHQLKRVPLFSSIKEEDLKLIQDKLDDVYFKKGDVIIREGDLGDCFYIIKQGTVRVETQPEDEGEPIILARLQDGDYFGEMALITGEPRSATVVAESDVSLWRLLKSDFDRLILNNPDITLSLTHMLSHRLSKTNKALQETEVQFLKKIHPRGEIAQYGIIRILNFAEQNALSGRIVFKKGDDTAVFVYEKGQLLHLDFDGKEEDEALDEILSWKEGTFFIEPKLFDLDAQPVSENPEWTPEEKSLVNTYERYFTEKFSELIQRAGSKNLQAALKKAIHKLKPIFDEIENLCLEILPELKIDFSKVNNFNDKYVLMLAMLLSQIIDYLSREVIGIDFFDLTSEREEINTLLEKNQFFDLYRESGDLV
ncbi:putative transcriptional regulator, Crp/Fnr family [Caldithrix abyssi DSM 13497]|uniref:Putative transcriptional regulator, Crp/Fnr family n=1 Tax=Caldithrix abyssi DSM 13497 TaxID=880073 RepID=H1XV39_CALAY|nr:cyclic nucleotide-binding domain-containing protein [Caldithrix abyssi]APF18912.1 protein of unknown function (DUF4388) [Caldithrix abyssi DSM 13497]EHO42872.1 putative transcriptional regulator, Crp/Fnr family [Caldithrix abyssi DSM 13497]